MVLYFWLNSVSSLIYEGLKLSCVKCKIYYVTVPCAWYHVMNCGSGREDFFRSRRDHEVYVQVLGETTGVWNIKVSWYSLMSSRYILLAHTSAGNLCRCCVT